MRILVSGASGLIGSALQKELRADGHEVRTLVRREPRDASEYEWRPDEGLLPAAAVEWADGVVTLSGAPLGRLPWTRAYRREIYRSRVTATRTVARAIATSASPPQVWVSGSATGFYGDRPGTVLTEDSGPGDGFLAGVVLRWEAATERADDVTRVVHVRTGLVMADGGALAPLQLATRLGAGASIGTGRQQWPWISLTDEARAIVHLLAHSELSGPVNLTGPQAATSADITRALAREMHRPHLFRLPAWFLRLVLGEPAEEMLLPDQRILPTRLQADGFTFRHATAEEAVAAAVR
ncbi:TIGR01777 family oxidoreductase [Georgenia satyanarayanai]|uniref:TIGR01777 family oxidoreductase n=1 Tax=Georgenia satyanarayanai TaxID=860221 RepID=UPI0012656A79|nr:TIGR01777 family oxidoreductase [Georgenia satyanarayanai]